MSVTESRREFYFKGRRTPSRRVGVTVMRCYFLRVRRVVGVAMLPLGLSEEETIARARKLSAKRRGPIDGFEVWDAPVWSSGIWR
jgi:hypothetical protein